MAEAIGGIPVRLAPGSKAAYHAAAVLAAGGIVALLDAIAGLRVASLTTSEASLEEIFLRHYDHARDDHSG